MRRRRRQRSDVVFYTPFIGWILSPGSSTPPGGAETQILKLARALSQRGVSAAIVVYDAGDLPHEVDGVRIVPRAEHKGNKRFAGKLLEAARIWLALWRTPSPVVVYRCASAELGLIGLYTRVARRRLVFSSASIVDFTPEQLISKRRDLILYRLGVRLADEIVVQTEEQVHLCEKAFGRTPSMIKSLSELATQQGEAAEAFLWVGRLVSYKKPYEYLALAEAMPEAKFWMVGVPAVEASEKVFSDGVISAAAKIENLDLLPPRPQQEVEELMRRAVASVNTADFEGMPNVLLEAWARGVPALALTHDPGGVISEYGLGGFAEGRKESLVSLARDQWRQRGNRASVSERCRRYISSHHAADVIVKCWLEVLRCRVATP